MSTIDPSTICQYTSLTDNNGRKIFEGDIIQLHITQELLQTSFRNSNLGKFVTKNELSDVILKLEQPPKFLSITYNIYFKKDGEFLLAREGQIDSQRGTDFLFPCYFVGSGGFIIGNIFDNPELLRNQ